MRQQIHAQNPGPPTLFGEMQMEKMHQRESTIGATSAGQIESLVSGEQGAPQGEREASKAGARGRFFVTPHAVERYRERVHRGISYERALEEILSECDRAHYVKDYVGGKQYWRGPKPMRLRLLVAPSVGSELPQLVTILPASDALSRPGRSGL